MQLDPLASLIPALTATLSMLVSFAMPQPVSAEETHPTLTREHASGFARLTLRALTKEYPNKPEHVMAGPDDVKSPRVLHPAFYGSYDWHSSVHGHWMLVRLLRLYPDLPEAREIRTVLTEHLTAENLKVEAEYFARKESRPFERPYGWAWLLKLAEELHGWNDPDGAGMVTEPAAARGRSCREVSGVLSKADLSHSHRRPPKHRVRARVRSRLRLGGRQLPAEETGRGAGAGVLQLGRGRPGKVGAVRRGLLLTEPDGSGPDAESVARRRVPGLVREVPAGGRHGRTKTALLARDGGGPDGPATGPPGRTEPQPGVVHAEHRCGLPAGDRACVTLDLSASSHAQAGLGHVASGDYAGEHWLASFAVYLLTARSGTDSNR